MIDSQPDLLLSLAASPNFRKDKLLFAGRRSGLYRSNDEGISWQPQSIVTEEILSVTALALSPNFVQDRTIFAALPGGVAYSHNAGDTWSWTKLPTPPPYISALAVSPSFENDGTLFAATLEDGVLRSVDGGVSWQAWNFGLLDKQVLCLGLKDEAVYAGTSTGLFRSHNRGRSWQEVVLPVQDSVLSAAVMGRALFIGTERNGLLRSDDGESWKQVKAKGLVSPINQIQVSDEKEASLRVLAGSKLLASDPNRRTWHEILLPSKDEPIVLAGLWVGFTSGQVAVC